MRLYETKKYQANWIVPTIDTLKEEFAEYKKKEQKKWKGRAVEICARFPLFDDFEDFVSRVRNGKIVSIKEAEPVYNLSYNTSIEDIKDMVSLYVRPRDVDRIVHGFETGSKMPMPLIIEGNCGRWIMAGNTRVNVARVLGLPVKVIIIDVKE